MSNLGDLLYLIYKTPRRPKNDAQQLRAIAAWMDTIDDFADELETGAAPKDRSMQADLRRIAAELEALP